MNGDLFETTMRRGEYFHGLTIPPGMWAVLRLDGRSFTTLTERRRVRVERDLPMGDEYRALIAGLLEGGAAS